MTVSLARALACDGIDSLRFDMSGIGESSDRRDQLGWEDSAPLEIREAIDQIDAPGTAIVLYGNCGGAGKSFLAARQDPRVRGLLLTNPPPHPSEEEGGDQERVRQHATQTARDLHAILNRGVLMFFIFAAEDPGLHYYDKWLRPALLSHLETGSLRVEIVQASNHTFSPAPARAAVIALSRKWLRRFNAVA